MQLSLPKAEPMTVATPASLRRYMAMSVELFMTWPLKDLPKRSLISGKK